MIGHVLGLLPGDEVGLPWGCEEIESLEDFDPSLEFGVDWTDDLDDEVADAVWTARVSPRCWCDRCEAYEPDGCSCSGGPVRDEGTAPAWFVGDREYPTQQAALDAIGERDDEDALAMERQAESLDEPGRAR